MALLEVKDLQVNYGVIRALNGISFEVNEGEIVTLIGANGAGKTTTMQTIIGLIPPKAGSIHYDGKDITKLPSHKIVNMGMSQVPEGRRIFQELSVYDNLMLGAYLEKDMSKIKARIENVFEQFPILKERRTQIAGTLSGGEQQMLAMSRALMAEQNAEKALGIADRAYVLTNGVITHQGTGAELAGSEEIKKAYLGG